MLRSPVPSGVVVTVLVSLMAAAGPGARAQNPSQMSPQQRQQMMRRAQDMQNAIYKQLGVTPAQKAKLERIQERHMAQIRSRVMRLQKQHPNATREQQQKMMMEMRPLAMKMQQEMMAVLTPAQRKKMMSMRMGGPGGGAAPPAGSPTNRR